MASTWTSSIGRIGNSSPAKLNPLAFKPTVTPLPSPSVLKPQGSLANTSSSVVNWLGSKPLTRYLVNTYASGDYIVKVYSDGTTTREYKPPFAGPTYPVQKSGTSATRSTGSTGSTSSSSGNYPGGASTVYNTNPAGSANSIGSPGGVTAGGASIGGSPDINVNGQVPSAATRPQYGWTENMSPNNIDAGNQYPMRILQQVYGDNISQAFKDFMSPMVSALSNPYAQLAMIPGIGGPGQEAVRQDEYNFRANMMKNLGTPGGGSPDIAAVMQNIAAMLQDPQSGLYNALQGRSSDQGGQQANAVIFDEFMNLIAPILTLGGSPLQNLATSRGIGLAQDQYLTQFDGDVGANQESPIEYIMRIMGYPTQVARMPDVQTSGAGNPNAINYGQNVLFPGNG